ncbi:MAG: MBL fold metallo-hydrolase [Solirubrobacteraceae bacterium]
MTPTVGEVGAGCHAWLRLPGGWGQTNLGLVLGRGASLLIDTAWDPRLTRSMLDAFSPQTDRAPVSLLVNTHPDVDHWWGNAELPGAEVLASATCAQAMHEEPTPQKLRALRRVAQLTGRLPGRAGAAGRYVSSMLAPFALEEVTLRFPDRTFTGRRIEAVGGREVELIDYGAAHTTSDSVVLVPDARVLYTGDLLFAGVTPVMWHGPVSSWLAALDAIMTLEADVFVPGHGPISTRKQLQALHDYWTWLTAAVAMHQSAGRSPLAIAKRLARAPEFAPFRAWESPERLYINVAAIARQLHGEGPIPTDPITRVKAFDGVACLCRHLESAR